MSIHKHPRSQPEAVVIEDWLKYGKLADALLENGVNWGDFL